MNPKLVAWLCLVVASLALFNVSMGLLNSPTTLSLSFVQRTELFRHVGRPICKDESICQLMRPISLYTECSYHQTVRYGTLGLRKTNNHTICPTVSLKLSTEASRLQSILSASASDTPIAVLIEGRTKPWDLRTLELLLQNALDSLPEAWKIHLFVRDPVIEHLVEQPWFFAYTRLCQKIVVHRMSDDFKLSKRVYNQLLSSEDFWANLGSASRVQLIEIDSGFCSSPTRQLIDYTQYDYCGAPWLYSCRSNATDPTRCVGNSGFSIWNLAMMVSLTRRFAHELPDEQSELLIDQFWGDRMRSGWDNVNICLPDAASLYSAETLLPSSGVPIGFHKPYVESWSQTERDRFYEVCPSYRVIFQHQTYPKPTRIESLLGAT
jgi:hypothetical protein